LAWAVCDPHTSASAGNTPSVVFTILFIEVFMLSVFCRSVFVWT